MKGLHLPVLVSINGGQRLEVNTLELTLVMDMTSNVIEDPFCHTGVGEDGKTILEKQGMSNKLHRLSIPAPYWKISGLHLGDLDPIVHIPSIDRTVPQMIITVLKNGLREDGRGGSGRDHGGGRGRHC